MTSIVVADDEVDLLSSTGDLLRLEGFTVTTVSDAAQILPTLIRTKPDILLQDVNMPGLDTAKLVPLIRSEASLRGLRILVFTASVDTESICKSLNADGFVQKPFDADRIKMTIDKYMSQKVSSR